MHGISPWSTNSRSSVVLSLAYVGNHGYHVTPGGTNYNINEPTIVGFGTLSTNQRRLFYNLYGWTQSIKYFSRRLHREVQLAAGSRRETLRQWVDVPGQLHLGKRIRLRQRLFLTGTTTSITAGRAASGDSCSTSTSVYELPFGKGKKFLSNASRAVDYRRRRVATLRHLALGIGLPVHAVLSGLREGRRYRPMPCRTWLAAPASRIPARTSGLPSRRLEPAEPGCLATAAATAELNANGCTRGPWSRPQPGTFGNVARDSFFGPHFFNADMSLSKIFRITERVNAQFRAESFNTFNHVNLGQPNATVDSPTAGQIFGIAGLSQMRKWQFGSATRFLNLPLCRKSDAR